MGTVREGSTRMEGAQGPYPSTRHSPPPVLPARSTAYLESAPGKLRLAPLRLLDLWHLLSLDAPAVAVAWLLLFNRRANLQLGYSTPTALFLGVWMLYAGDRLLDARTWSALASGRPRFIRELELRHRFHHRHRRVFTTVLAVVFPLLALLLFRLPPAVLRGEATLAVLLAGWLVLIHQPAARGRPRRLPKEFAVGLFFAPAVCLPALLARPLLWPALLSDAALFYALCTLNCLFLYAWEHPHDRRRAHPATRWAIEQLLPLTAITLAVGAALLFGADRRVLPVPLACVVSTALLLLLHSLRTRLRPVRLRALADLVLLTPLLFLACS